MAVHLLETQDGSHTLLSDTYGVSYHSRYGAIQESRHVFIEAGLYPAIVRRKTLRILELGFGTGLNALLTLEEARQRGLTVFYEAVEAHPISPGQAALLNYPEQLQCAGDRPLFQALHTAAWDEAQPITSYFTLRKLHAPFETAPLGHDFDLLYYDAFAPGAQPELWEENVLRRAYDALAPHGVLVTYCAKGSVKRALRNLGFQLEALPGPPGKREMTRAVKVPVSR